MHKRQDREKAKGREEIGEKSRAAQPSRPFAAANDLFNMSDDG